MLKRGGTIPTSSFCRLNSWQRFIKLEIKRYSLLKTGNLAILLVLCVCIFAMESWKLNYGKGARLYSCIVSLSTNRTACIEHIVKVKITVHNPRYVNPCKVKLSLSANTFTASTSNRPSSCFTYFKLTESSSVGLISNLPEFNGVPV